LTTGRSTKDNSLRGDEIRFVAGGAADGGRVSGLSIEGTFAPGGNTSRRAATRTN